MIPNWVQLSDNRKVCIEGDAETVQQVAATLGLTVIGSTRIPYPAEPRVGPQSECPSFCYSPNTCVGRSACPKSYACSE